ncbi:MAG: cellulase family glycosylhydrolase, partial [Candidatus Omnitrophota bacterium]
TLNSYLSYTLDYLNFLNSNSNGRNYRLFSRTHYPWYDAQRNVPTMFLRGRHFRMVKQESSGYINLMPGNSTLDGYTSAERGTYNGPGTYRHAVHPAPFYNIHLYINALIEKLRAINGLSGQAPVTEAEYNQQREYTIALKVRGFKGFGGAGQVNSSYQYSLRRHTVKTIFLSVVTLGLGILGFAARLYLSANDINILGVTVPDIREINLGLFYGVVFFATLAAISAGIMLSKIFLFVIGLIRGEDRETVTWRDILRFVPAHLLAGALSRITQRQINPANVAIEMRNLARSSLGILRNRYPSEHPIYRLQLETIVVDILYFVNALDRRTQLLTAARTWDINRFSNLADQHIGNEDIFKQFQGLDEVEDFLNINPTLYPRIALMDTTFGDSSGARVVATLEDMEHPFGRTDVIAAYPISRVLIVPCLDDDDNGGRTSLSRIPAHFVGNVERVYSHQEGTNLARNQHKLRMKPPMNVEAVKQIAIRCEQRKEELPGYVELIDQEDRLQPLNLKYKLSVWAMRDRVVAEQLQAKEITNRADASRFGIRLNTRRLTREYNRLINRLQRLAGVTIASLRNSSVDQARILLKSNDLRAHARYTLLAVSQVWPDVDSFIQSEFRQRNLPTIMQTELRLVPIQAPDPSMWDIRSYLDYLIWHSTIQPGQTASGFLFLGGTGNCFRWDMLATTRPVLDGDRNWVGEAPLNDRAELMLLLQPLRELVHHQETDLHHRVENPGARRSLIYHSSSMLRALNSYMPSGTWDLYNQIEDSELGRRLALFNLRATRLTGKFTQILEDELPGLGRAWHRQRQRWITMQTFAAVLAHPAAFGMFFGQYVGFALGLAIFAGKGVVLLGLAMGAIGFVLGGLLFYLLGHLYFYIGARANLIRNSQWHIDPVRTLGFYKFQQIAHLAASTPSSIVTFIMLVLTLVYFAATAGISVLQNIGLIDILGGFGLLLNDLASNLQALIPIMQLWLVTTIAGVVVFITPPFIQTFMGWIVNLIHGPRDEEATIEALRVRFIHRAHELRFLGGERLLGHQIADYRNDTDVLNALDNYRGIIEGIQRQSDVEIITDVTNNPDSNTAIVWADLNRARPRGQGVNQNAAGVAIFRRALNIVLEEVTSARREVNGEIHFGRGTLITGLVFLGLGSILLFGWPISLGVSIALSLAKIIFGLGSVLSLLAILSSMLRAISGGRTTLFITSRLMAHAIRFFGIVPSMIHYFNHLLIAAWCAMGMSLRPWINEGYWTRGRNESMSTAMGNPSTIRGYFRQARGWLQSTGMVFITFIVLTYTAILAVPAIDGMKTYFVDTNRSYQIETTIANYVDGVINLEDDTLQSIVVAQALNEDISGWVRGKVDFYETVYNERIANGGKKNEELRLWKLIQFSTDAYRLNLNAQVDAGDKDQKTAQWNYEWLVDYLEQSLYRMGREDQAQEIFGLTPMPLNNKAWQGVNGVKINTDQDDNMTSIDLSLKGRTVFATDVANAEIYLDLPQNLDMLGRQFVIEIKVPESFEGRWIQGVVIDENGNEYYSGSYTELTNNERDSQNNTLGKWILVRVKPEMPEIGSFNPQAVKKLVIRMGGVVAHSVEGRIQIRSIFVENRPDFTKPLVITESSSLEIAQPQIRGTLPAGTQPIVAGAEIDKREFLRFSGKNLSWDNGEMHYGWSVGENPYRGAHGGFSANTDELNKIFTALKEAGVGLVRVWLFADLRTGVILDGSGVATEFDDKVYPDMDALVNAAQANGIKIIPVLFDFTLADGGKDDNGKAGEYPEFINDANKRAALVRLFNSFVARYKDSPAIVAWDIMNEPEYVTSVNQDQVRDFLMAFSGMLHSQGQKVTIGSRNYNDALRYQAIVDINQFHWYPDMGYVFDGNVASLGFTKPVLVGEVGVGTKKDMTRVLNDAFSNGYMGLLFWDGVWAGASEDQSIIFDLETYKTFAAQKAVKKQGAQAPLKKQVDTEVAAAPVAGTTKIDTTTTDTGVVIQSDAGSQGVIENKDVIGEDAQVAQPETRGPPQGATPIISDEIIDILLYTALAILVILALILIVGPTIRAKKSQPKSTSKEDTPTSPIQTLYTQVSSQDVSPEEKVLGLLTGLMRIKGVAKIKVKTDVEKSLRRIVLAIFNRKINQAINKAGRVFGVGRVRLEVNTVIKVISDALQEDDVLGKALHALTNIRNYPKVVASFYGIRKSRATKFALFLGERLDEIEDQEHKGVQTQQGQQQRDAQRAVREQRVFIAADLQKARDGTQPKEQAAQAEKDRCDALVLQAKQRRVLGGEIESVESEAEKPEIIEVLEVVSDDEDLGGVATARVEPPEIPLDALNDTASAAAMSRQRVSQEDEIRAQEIARSENLEVAPSVVRDQGLTKKLETQQARLEVLERNEQRLNKKFAHVSGEVKGFERKEKRLTRKISEEKAKIDTVLRQYQEQLRFFASAGLSEVVALLTTVLSDEETRLTQTSCIPDLNEKLQVLRNDSLTPQREEEGRLGSQISQTRDEIAQLRAEIKKTEEVLLQEKKQAVRAKLEERLVLQRRILNLENQTRDLHEQISGLEREIACHELLIVLLQRAIGLQQDEVNTLTTSYTNLRIEGRKQKDEALRNLNTQIAEIETKIAQDRKKLRALSDEAIPKLEEELQTQRITYKQKQAKLEELKATPQVQQIFTALKRLSQKDALFKPVLEACLKVLNVPQLTQEVKDANERVESLDRQLKEQNIARDALNLRVKDNEANLDHQHQTRKNLLDAPLERLDVAIAQLTAARREYEDLRRRLGQVKASIINRQRQRDQKEIAVPLLRERITLLQPMQRELDRTENLLVTPNIYESLQIYEEALGEERLLPAPSQERIAELSYILAILNADKNHPNVLFAQDYFTEAISAKRASGMEETRVSVFVAALDGRLEEIFLTKARESFVAKNFDIVLFFTDAVIENWNPDSSTAHYLRGLAYFSQGRAQDAREELLVALRLGLRDSEKEDALKYLFNLNQKLAQELLEDTFGRNDLWARSRLVGLLSTNTDTLILSKDEELIGLVF